MRTFVSHLSSVPAAGTSRPSGGFASPSARVGLVFAIAFASAAATGCAPATGQAPCAPTTVASATPPPADDLDTKSSDDLATELLELTGAANLGKQIMDGMSDSMAKMPGLPPGFIDQFKKNAHPDELMKLIIPIYVKNYDKETMIAAIRFYQSKSGRTMIAALPTVTRESMEVGKVWGRELAQKTLADMGIVPSKTPPQSP
jgi:hypothetical protein